MTVARRVLVLGGTNFVGRHITDLFMEREWDVTLFNRGVTNADLYPDVPRIVGNRHLDVAPGLDNLATAVADGATWDVVVDVTGYDPAEVAATVRLLRPATERYIFISTGAVYQIPFPTDGDESTPVRTDPQRDGVYGANKLLSERAVRETFGGAALVVRLGLQCGPHDDTDRITYWVDRIRRGGEVLVPARPEWSFSTVDVRDTAWFVIQGATRGFAGTYNTTGAVVTWRRWVEACRDVAGSECRFVWVDDWEFLERHAPEPGRRFGAYPMRMPPEWGDWWSCRSDAAQQLGLVYRPLEESIEDILRWSDARTEPHEWVTGLDAKDEQRILAAWSARTIQGVAES